VLYKRFNPINGAIANCSWVLAEAKGLHAIFIGYAGIDPKYLAGYG